MRFMRINKLVAQATGLSRRAADQAISERRVLVNGRPASAGQQVTTDDKVEFDGQTIGQPIEPSLTLILHKPAGYVVSRRGQGSRTIYDLLPLEYHSLKPVGRLDKDSSGLLLLTNDGQLAYQLTHPSFVKPKIYEIELDKPLLSTDQQQIEQGVKLDDGPSKLLLRPLGDQRHWQITMHEGRNRQIRRSFDALGYRVAKLHRTHFGPYALDDLASGQLRLI